MVFPHFLLHRCCFLSLFSWLEWSSARKAGRILKKKKNPQMAGKRLANSPRRVRAWNRRCLLHPFSEAERWSGANETPGEMK